MPSRQRAFLLMAILVATATCEPGAGASVEPSRAPSIAPSATSLESSPTPSTDQSDQGSAPVGTTEIAVVLSITDGDTIRVDRGHGSEPVRYIGMNTPEVGDPGGDEATAANAALVEGQEVVLERDVSETDQFGRLLRYVWLHDGSTWLLVNRELVLQGFAQVATYPPDVRYVDLFIAVQRLAREHGVGLWAPALAPTEAPADTPTPAANCHPSYDPCLPIVDDLNCPDVRAMGLAPVRVIGPDDYGLDGDHDGLGCE